MVWSLVTVENTQKKIIKNQLWFIWQNLYYSVSFLSTAFRKIMQPGKQIEHLCNTKSASLDENTIFSIYEKENIELICNSMFTLSKKSSKNSFV